MATYKRRRNPFEGEDGRAKAIKRIQDEMSVRQKMGQARAKMQADRARQPVKQDRPEAQQHAAERLRQRANRERNVTSHGGAIPAPNRGQDRPRFMTNRGPRRLSYAQPFGNRTTDSSRARVMKLYGRSAPPTPTAANRAPRRLHKPVSNVSPEQQAAQMRSKVGHAQKSPYLRRRSRARAY